MHEIKFPTHTQARMDAAKAVKEAKIPKPADPVDPVALPQEQEHKTPRLPGYIDGLDSDARRAILENRERVAIAYGTVENPIILVEKVNVAMLRQCKYYIASVLRHPWL